MKLSKKGFKKIISTCKFDDAIATYTLNFSSPDKDYCFEVQGTSFKSNDFEDCVMLTIKEAKEILQSSYDVLSWADCPCIQKENALNVQELLKYRIEQAEAQNEVK